MIAVSITVNDAGVAAHVEGEIDEMVWRFAQAIERHFQRIIRTGSRSGRLYRRGGFKRGSSRGLRLGGRRARGAGTRIHRASAAGEPLASDTGRTADSFTIRRLKKGVVRIRVGGGAAHWEIRSTAARPTLQPAIEAAAEEIFGGHHGP